MTLASGVNRATRFSLNILLIALSIQIQWAPVALAANNPPPVDHTEPLAPHYRNLQKPTNNGQPTSPGSTANTTVGAGGEIHQTAGGNFPTLTTQQGIPVSFRFQTIRIL
jgi:hypothetical protein